MKTHINKVFGIIVGLIAVGAVGWLVISNKSAPTQTQPQATSVRAPDFVLQDFGDNTVRHTDFAGKRLVINAWAAWCPFCQKELVDFALAQKEFGDDVVIIAIDRAESRETAKKYTDDLGVTNNLIFLLDPSDSFYQSISGFSMPETIFVDKNGNITEHKRGPMDRDEIRQKIQTLIAE